MRILIAGLGAVGQRHARNLRALRGDDVELHAFRRRGDRAIITERLARDGSRDVHAELGITPHTTLDAALAAKPDAVFVCTPTAMHLEVAQAAADAGCHLFLEKPVSHSLDGTDRLLTSVRRNRLIAMVGCQWRFHPCIEALRRLIVQGGPIGGPVSAEITYQEYLPDWHPYEDYRTSYAARADMGGGVILTQIHDYDLAHHLFGPLRVVGATGGHLNNLEIDVEDTVDARLRAGAVSVRIRQTFAARPPVRTIVVQGAEATVHCDLLAATLRVDPPLAPDVSFPEYERNRMFVEEASHFLDCVEGNEPAPMIPLEEGLDVLRTALEVRRQLPVEPQTKPRVHRT